MQYVTKLDYVDQKLEHSDVPLRIACDECREVTDCVLYTTYTSPGGRVLCWYHRPVVVHGKLTAYAFRTATHSIEDLYPHFFTY